MQETHVILRIIEGNIPSIVEKPSLSQVNMLFELIERCWDMDPKTRVSATDCHSFMAGMNMVVPPDTLIKGERLPSVELLQALSQTHFAEGRVGEGIRYLLKSSCVAQVAGRHYAGVEYRRQLLKHKRSISRVETVHEEEAVGAWNMALELAATQMDREAESHLLHAAFRYKEIGFQTQVLECEQFLAGLEEVVRYQPPSSLCKPSQAVDGEGQRKHMQPIPSITHAIYSRKGGPSNIVWFIAGALQRASPDPLNPREIFSLIQKYQLWKFVSGVVLKGQQEIIVKFSPSEGFHASH
ncbi:hypothetical protein FS837_012308 [Tulasnella sp. UAMH 9824]|nr:hypothetical protein FS837_012308 [Tulasnella sp. UAMH 9824]